MFYSWEFVGNKWKDQMVYSTDSTPVDTLVEKVFVDIIGSQNSPDKWRDVVNRGQDSEGGMEQDNALQVIYEDIAPGHAVKVSRLDAKPDDYRAYNLVKLYIHNDVIDEANPGNNPMYYLRVGVDSASYYEFRGRIDEGVLPPQSEDGLWREFSYDIWTIAQMKFDSFLVLNDDSLGRGVISSDSTFRIKGYPSFHNIMYYELGLVNNTSQALTGEIWFNDIRLSEPIIENGNRERRYILVS